MNMWIIGAVALGFVLALSQGRVLDVTQGSSGQVDLSLGGEIIDGQWTGTLENPIGVGGLLPYGPDWE